MHLSGILSCIVATVTVHHVLTRTISYGDMRMAREEKALEEDSAGSKTLMRLAVEKIKATVEERERHLRTKEDVQLLAVVANTMLFVAMAEIIDFSLLWHYRVEIFAMFVATTVIRALMMAKFAWIANRTGSMVSVNFRWWGVLTFAGIKGGLSVVMLMMIPADFAHLEMFKAIVIGVILLSTVVYSALLLLMILRHQDTFADELDEEEKEGEH